VYTQTVIWVGLLKTIYKMLTKFIEHEPDVPCCFYAV